MAQSIQMFEAKDGTVFKNHVDAVSHDREVAQKDANTRVVELTEKLKAALYPPDEKGEDYSIAQANGLMGDYVRALEAVEKAKQAFNEPVPSIMSPPPPQPVYNHAPAPRREAPPQRRTFGRDAAPARVAEQIDDFSFETGVVEAPSRSIQEVLDERRAAVALPASVRQEDSPPESEQEELFENDLIDDLM